MAYDPGAIDATLAAAVGDEPGLIAELRAAFVESAEKTIDAIQAAESDNAWRLAAARLKGLAASFGAVRLMGLASEAASTPGNADVVRTLRRAVARI